MARTSARSRCPSSGSRRGVAQGEAASEIPAGTPQELALLNQLYLGTDAPLPYLPKSKSWSVLEPFGGALGPYDDEDEAAREMTGWAHEIKEGF